MQSWYRLGRACLATRSTTKHMRRISKLYILPTERLMKEMVSSLPFCTLPSMCRAVKVLSHLLVQLETKVSVSCAEVDSIPRGTREVGLSCCCA